MTKNLFIKTSGSGVFYPFTHRVLVVKYRRQFFAEKEVAWWQTEHINSECIPMMNERTT